MGCCISTCRPKNHSPEDLEFDNHVQDKLVISQQALPKAPKMPNIPMSAKISPSPPSPTPSLSSISSFTCSTASKTNTSSTCSSVLSSTAGSSILASKDRSFSNEFLRSCVKANPQMTRINSMKEYSQLVVPPYVYAKKLASPAKQAAPPPKPQRIIGSTPQKRARSSSPCTLTRQKSFRREPEGLINSLYSLPGRSSLRSPSPSRRFSGFSPKEIGCSKRMVGSKVNAGTINSFSPSMRKENFRPISPYINSSHLRLRNRETCIHRISSKIDEIAVQAAVAEHDSDSVPMEDIDNPLISLDCFIFV